MSNFSFSQPNASRNPWSLSVRTNEKKLTDGKTHDNIIEDPFIFRTARQQMVLEEKLKGKKFNLNSDNSSNCNVNSNTQNVNTNNFNNLPNIPNITSKRLGTHGPFINPMKKNDNQANTIVVNNYASNKNTHNQGLNSNFNQNDNNSSACPDCEEIFLDERTKGLDKVIVERILNEIIDKKSTISWENIGGLEKIKDELEEIVILPMQRPDLFVDLLSPCKGLLLFGPPGTGKTLIGKCIASQSNSTFFSISASSLTSKWIGEGEKLVRTLFTVARIKQPSVIFIDEIDSLLTQRSDSEHESSRRLKTEFLIQFDGLTTDCNENLLVIGATNRPQELDEAARRRFTKRLYIPLPNLNARKDIISLLLKNQRNSIDEKSLIKLCKMTKGYSGADLAYLCKDAALNVIRRFGKNKVHNIKDRSDLPEVSIEDFLTAVKRVKPSVCQKDLNLYLDWNAKFGAIFCSEDDEGELMLANENSFTEQAKYLSTTNHKEFVVNIKTEEKDDSCYIIE